MVEGEVEVSGDVLTLPGGAKLDVKSAVHFLTDVTETGDPYDVIGRVKDLEALAKLGGEQIADSVLIGDTAYVVVEGFLCTPQPDQDFGSVAADDESGPACLARFFEKTSGGV